MSKAIDSAAKQFSNCGLFELVRERGGLHATQIYGFLRDLLGELGRLEAAVRARVGPKSLFVDSQQHLKVNPQRLYSGDLSGCWWLRDARGLKPERLETRQLACFAYWMLTGKQPLGKGKFLSRKRLEAKLSNIVTATTASEILRGLYPSAELSAGEFVSRFGRSLQRLGRYRIRGVQRYSGSNIHYLGLSPRGVEVTLRRYEPVRTMRHRDLHLGRFYLHAKLAMQLSPGPVPDVHEVGSDGSIHYCVQDKLTGRYVLDRVQSDGPLCADEALSVAARIAEGLSSLHETGLLLRNIQPGNLFIRSDDEILFTWLGDCRILGAGLDLVEPNHAVGNRLYTAPEIMRDATSADSSSDLFSLAAVLYYLLFARSPFEGVSRDSLYRHKTHWEPWRSQLLKSRVNPSLLGLFDRVLCRKSQRKIRSARHFAEVCRRIQQRLEEG